MNFETAPMWVTIAKRGLTLFVLAAFGLHAYVWYRRRGGKLLAPERLVFLAFSITFLFAVTANFVAFELALEFGRKRGPFNLGIFSLLTALLYLVFAGSATRRARLQ